MGEGDCFNPVCRESPLGELRKRFQPHQTSHECPLDRQSLGVYSWSLMHTFAIYYPENPSEAEKEIMKGWLKGFRDMYPCSHCRAHFQIEYDKNPPKLNNTKELSLWVCFQHNQVNKILGKTLWDCEYESLIKRWKTGCNFDEY